MDGRARGIDVSHYDPAIDWNAAVAAGITFAFAKASEGADPASASYTDAMFATHWPAMKGAGVIRGAYHFIGLPLPTTPQDRWFDDLHSQIDHFLEVIGPLEAGDLPPTLDLESGDSPARWATFIKNNRSAALDIVRELILYTTRQLGGITPILYTGEFWWDQLGNPTADPAADNMPFSGYPLWMAQYALINPPVGDPRELQSFAEYDAHLDGRTPLHIPILWGGDAAPSWQFWQFSSQGSLGAGIHAPLDLNVFNGTLADLGQLTLTA